MDQPVYLDDFAGTTDDERLTAALAYITSLEPQQWRTVQVSRPWWQRWRGRWRTERIPVLPPIHLGPRTHHFGYAREIPTGLRLIGQPPAGLREGPGPLGEADPGNE